MEFWNLFETAMAVSPYDGAQLPSVSMIETVGVGSVLHMTRESFWSAVGMSLDRYRSKFVKKRIDAMRKAGKSKR